MEKNHLEYRKNRHLIAWIPVARNRIDILEDGWLVLGAGLVLGSFGADAGPMSARRLMGVEILYKFSCKVISAMLAYKTLSGTKNFKKAVHLSIQFVALCFGIIGVWAALKFHNEKGIENFYSLHSWLGLTSITLFGIQWGLGFATFWYPGGSRNSRAFLLPWHVFLGVYIYALAVATAATGILEKATFLQSNKVISRYSTEAFLINFLGILLVVLGGFVTLAVVTPAAGKAEPYRNGSD
ncbi:hypothetical protein Taro_003137 [Colocasia esculenta]|uniref:Cytochrome b561 domain-containing protein n=1 Tax=Colocasia esculenta TaxID=4460 RepID=A0A843TIW2_COLES|nr:hypothetical protein [Colocasia esculenta]